MRNIYKGEEIFTSYVPLGEVDGDVDAGKRSTVVEQRCGFVCGCRACGEGRRVKSKLSTFGVCAVVSVGYGRN